jgi:hypothetical protein
MRIWIYSKYIFIIAAVAILSMPVLAQTELDSDQDGIPDEQEIKIYHTDPFNPDTDGDSYNDGDEIRHGYSPLNPDKNAIFKDSDYDHDGLSDGMEIKFKTDLANPDTDGDGYQDGKEVSGAYDPTASNGKKLDKKIEINTGQEQKLYYFLGNVRMGEFKISSGVAAMPTPKGNFKIDGKSLRAWSKYGLWMPNWMSLKNGYFGIHELPEWPNGKKEGENHLGRPASHGCVRLSPKDAKFLYAWAPIGTPVKIY